MGSLRGHEDGSLSGVRLRTRARRRRVPELRSDHRRLRGGRGVRI